MIYRIDVWADSAASSSGDGGDPVGQAVRHQIAEFVPHIGVIRLSPPIAAAIIRTGSMNTTTILEHIF